MVVSSNVCSSLNTMDFTIIFQNFQRFILVNFGKENRNAQIFLQISFMAAQHRLSFQQRGPA